MRKTVFLHIGYFKTGTSSIQRYFDRYRNALLEHGLLYPENGVHTATISHAFLPLKRLDEIGEKMEQWFKNSLMKMEEPPTASQIWRKAVKEIEASKASRIVISSEEFVRYASNEKTKTLIREVRDHLAPYDVRIICYIRRQDDYLESMYNQLVKMGNRVPEACSLSFLESLEQIHWNYLATLEAWEEVFGRERMIVRIFERDTLVGNDAIKDFLYIIFGDGAVNVDNYPFKHRNVSISNRLIELKRVCNHHLSGVYESRYKSDERMKKVLRKVEAIHNSRSDGKRHRLLSFEDRMLIVKRSEEMNREISRRYLSGKWPLFTEIGEEEEDVPIAGEPGIEETLLLLLGMVTEQYLRETAQNENMASSADLLRRIEEIKRSRSWRITAPLRKLSERFFK